VLVSKRVLVNERIKKEVTIETEDGFMMILAQCYFKASPTPVTNGPH
jgi:hypothetical protein